MSQTLIIHFKEEEQYGLAYRSKKPGSFIVQHIGTDEPDKEIPTLDGNVDRFKKAIELYYGEGYRVTSITNRKGLGLNMESTVVLNKIVVD